MFPGGPAVRCVGLVPAGQPYAMPVRDVHQPPRADASRPIPDRPESGRNTPPWNSLQPPESTLRTGPVPRTPPNRNRAVVGPLDGQNGRRRDGRFRRPLTTTGDYRFGVPDTASGRAEKR